MTSRATFRASLLAATMFAVTPALAQTTPPSSVPDANAPANGSDQSTVQPEQSAGTDIIVTAQRRNERLQDVPLSVTAVTGEQLRNAQITTADRLEQVVPGVRLGRSGSDLRPAIRGTYTENVAANGDPRIGVYVDDVYQSRTSQVPPIVDLDRVEVQKGPQGTLYGRNSFGGNIVFHSALPTNTFGAGVDATYGRYNQARIEAFVNAPLADGIGLRVAGLYERQDGYIHNINPNGNDAGGQDTYFGRATLRVAPSSVPALELIARASYQHYGGSGLGGFYLKSLGSPTDPTYIQAPGGSITRNGVTFNFPNGYNGNTYSGSLLAPYDTRYRDGIPDINGADIGIPIVTDPYTINNAGNIFTTGHQSQFSGQASYDLGAVKLRSITSYTDFTLTRTGGSITPVLLNYNYLRTAARTFTQELQLLSSNSDSPFQYVIGGYYFNDKVVETSVSNTNRSYNGNTAPLGQQYYNFQFTYLPTNTPINQTLSGDSLGVVQQNIRSYAGYGQISYTLASRLTITGGIRYTSDHKDVLTTAFNTGATGGTGGGSYYVYNINNPVNPVCGGYEAADASSNATNLSQAYKYYCGSLTQHFTTYRGSIDYKFSRNHMIYASYSTGAHSGGFNTGVVNGALIPFAPEKVQAYEIGTKNTFLNGMVTLNAALFLNNYSSLQAQTSIPNPQNAASVLALVQNIGRDRAYGLDLEAILRPSRALTVNIAFNWLHARELDYEVNTFNYNGFCSITNCAPGALGSYENQTVQGSPFPNLVTDPNRFVPIRDASGNIALNAAGQPIGYNYVVAGKGVDGTRYQSRKAFSPEYTVQIGAAYKLDLGGSGSLTPEVQFYFNSGYILTDLTPNFGNQPSYTKTDLRLTYRTADDRFRIQAFVNNVEDQAVITRAVYGANRDLQALYAPPRTYGISAGVRF